MVQAHAYWRLKGLAVDLVIWNEDHDVYRQQLQEQILGLIAAGVEAHFVERPGGGIFVRHAEQISNEDRLLFESVARVIISDGRGTLAEQISRRAPVDVRVPRLTPTRTYRPEPPLEPRGTRDRSHGLRVGMKAEFSVDDPMANSSMFVLPSRTAPASARRAA